MTTPSATTRAPFSLLEFPHDCSHLRGSPTMSPLDDQLRATLHGRATALTPAPDPFAGIESRARRLRRRRGVASVAGAALAVAAIAVAVPSLLPGSGSRSPQIASSGTSALPPNALRQSIDDVGTTDPGSARQVVATWAARHPGDGQVYSLTLVDGTSQSTPPLTFMVLEIWRAGGPAYAVVAQDTDTTRPTLVRDTVLDSGAALINGVVRGVGSVSLVDSAAAGRVARVEYDPGDGSYRATPPTARPQTNGVLAGVASRTGPGYAPDALVAIHKDGRVSREDVWTESTVRPKNLLDWPARGAASLGPDPRQLLADFAKSFNRNADQAQYRALFSGRSPGGLRYTFGQAWFSGEDTAYAVSYTTGGTNGPAFFLGKPTDPSATVVAYAICCAPGATTDTLVVIPQPRTGQVLYSPDATGSFDPKESLQGDDGVVLIDRDPRAMNDRLTVLDGNGDLDKPTYQGPVGALLCGATECG